MSAWGQAYNSASDRAPFLAGTVTAAADPSGTVFLWMFFVELQLASMTAAAKISKNLLVFIFNLV
jgi:hypothetical protein